MKKERKGGEGGLNEDGQLGRKGEELRESAQIKE